MQSAIGLVETQRSLGTRRSYRRNGQGCHVEIVKRVDIGGAYVTTIVSGRR